MEVISRGVIPAERKWRGNCVHCRSEVTAVESELTNITYDQREGSFSWEKCPVCEAGESGYGGLLLYPEPAHPPHLGVSA